MASVFIVDDHPLMIECLQLLIGSQPALRIVGSAGDCTTAWAGIEEVRPDLVIMDLDIPDCGGGDLTERIVSVWPATKVLVFTGSLAPKQLIRALQAGAKGIVSKAEARGELLGAIETVRGGRQYLSPSVANLLAGEIGRGTGSRSPFTPLSAREKEVVTRIAHGQTTKEIAYELGLSTKTVETHRAHAQAKIGASGVAELTKFALREGLIAL